jgi:hypothetical protein
MAQKSALPAKNLKGEAERMFPMFALAMGSIFGTDCGAKIHHLRPYARWDAREISARETERFKEPAKRGRDPESGRA